MRKSLTILLSFAAIAGTTMPSFAGFSVSFSEGWEGGRFHGGYRDWDGPRFRHPHGYWGPRYYGWRAADPYWPAIIEPGPVIVQQPVYYSQPVYQPAPVYQTPVYQAPVEPEHRDLGMVEEQIHRQRLTLAQKVRWGSITRPQYDEQVAYLAQIERQAQAESSANGGYLTVSQQNGLLSQLQHSADEIDHNFDGAD